MIDLEVWGKVEHDKSKRKLEKRTALVFERELEKTFCQIGKKQLK
jgi:hypothetical protein